MIVFFGSIYTPKESKAKKKKTTKNKQIEIQNNKWNWRHHKKELKQ